MRRFIVLTIIAAATLVPAVASAQDAEAMRKELEQMRKQFESMKESYEKSINSLSERLQKIESAPAPTAVAPPPGPAVSQAPPGAPPDPPPSGGMPSVMELVRPRQPFALYERRGAGQMLFDMGVAGDFIGNLTQHNVEQAQGGTFPGLENYFFPGRSRSRCSVRSIRMPGPRCIFEAEQESRGGELNVRLAEANLTLMTLPFNTQAKLGKMRNRFGLMNQLHDHDMPFIDRPDVLVQFLGQEGLVESGGEATWVPPLPFYVELLGGVFNGDNETASARRASTSHSSPVVCGRSSSWGLRRAPARHVGGQEGFSPTG